MPMTELFTLGRDAELRNTASGMAVCNLSLAYNYGQKDQATGKKPSQWIDGALWGKRAEAMAQYLLKGTKLVCTIEDLHIETFTTRDQQPGQKLAGNIIAIQFVPMPRTEAAAPPAAPPPPRPAPVKTGFDDMDDMPF